MKLIDFVKDKMRMSHIYQPVMIKSLLEGGGRLTAKEIAKHLLIYDTSQIEYYEQITKNMVGRVLRNHGVVKLENRVYELDRFDDLSTDEKDAIIKICEQKIAEFVAKRGDDIWSHRLKNRQAVPGSIRYNVLKRAHHRCELCGISAEEKALEVDHITPKNLGGEDSINNYQALCYTCNAQKKDLDNTDFRQIDKIFEEKNDSCVFCNMSDDKVTLQNNLAKAFFDKYPVSELHLLVIPKRHVKDYFDLHQAEINALHHLILQAKDELLQKDSTIKGFNIGTNIGSDAGQTIFHCHIHLIPRRENDVPNPIGGIRNIFPGEGAY